MTEPTSSLINPDLAPVPPERRTWNVWHIASLWVGMSVCIPTYMLAAGMIAAGLNWWQSLLAVLLGNAIVFVPLAINGHAGTRYGIPFPVFARAAFGLRGAHVPSLLRSVIGCGWFGIQTWLGGFAINVILGIVWPGWRTIGGDWTFMGHAAPLYLSFLIFWLVNMYFVWAGTESIKWMETLSAPFLIVTGLALLWWAAARGGGLGNVLAASSRLSQSGSTAPSPSGFLVGLFLPWLTAMVGFWATLSLNIPDFSRFARSQRDQIIGQVVGLPVTMLLFAGLGVVMTSASAQLVGETISDPITLIGRIDSPVWVVLSMIVIIIATISTNTAANIVSPTNDFQNVAPRLIDQRKGVLLTGIIGIVLMSWELLKRLGWLQSDVSLDSLYSNWLIGYSSLLGPIAGIMIVDYFVVRRQHYDLPGLYLDNGAYPAWNAAGFVAFLVPVALTLAAITTGALQWFYTYGWFTGSLLGALIYYVLGRRSTQKAAVAQSVASRA
jgi:nucleobase:cation symporter-1, NCS1 family